MSIPDVKLPIPRPPPVTHPPVARVRAKPVITSRLLLSWGLLPASCHGPGTTCPRSPGGTTLTAYLDTCYWSEVLMSLHVISLSLFSNRSLENHLMARIYPPQGNHEHSCLWTGAGQTCHPRIPSYQHQPPATSTSTGLAMTRTRARSRCDSV